MNICVAAVNGKFSMGMIDLAVLVGFLIITIAFALWKSRGGEKGADFFLGGRGLMWPIIGLSIVAANISTEQMVGMAGNAAGGVGLAVSNWQLVGSVGIVLIAWTLLPQFLRSGITTIPEFLEYRYTPGARAVMAILTVIIYVVVLLTGVLFSGGVVLQTIFGIPLWQGALIMGVLAAGYTAAGGLKAVAYADLLLGTALLLGGALVFFLGLQEAGGWSQFTQENASSLHMVLPSTNKELPWTGVVGGMGIVILYYCGLNQFIVQRSLAAKSLKHGQLGVIFAGALWLLVPFVIVMPGIMANKNFTSELQQEADKTNSPIIAEFERMEASPSAENPLIFNMNDDWKKREPAMAARMSAYNAQIKAILPDTVKPIEKNLLHKKADAAFPVMIRKLMPIGLRGFMFAAIAGAVISSLASMLNSASTIFTMDVYKRLFHHEKDKPRHLAWIGRIAILVFITIGCLLAPMLDHPQFGGVFKYIQQFQGYIWPGVVAAFVFGLWSPRTPRFAGMLALILGPLFYFVLQKTESIHQLNFLLQVMIDFIALSIILIIMTLDSPLKEPVKMPVRNEIETKTSKEVYLAGGLVIACVAVFYIIFW